MVIVQNFDVALPKLVWRRSHRTFSVHMDKCHQYGESVLGLIAGGSKTIAGGSRNSYKRAVPAIGKKWPTLLQKAQLLRLW